MKQDHRDLLVNSVCDIDAWSKMGTIPDAMRDKIQQVTSAFYWMTAEYDKGRKVNAALLEACKAALDLFAHGVGATCSYDPENAERNVQEARKIMAQLRQAIAAATRAEEEKHD